MRKDWSIYLFSLTLGMLNEINDFANDISPKLKENEKQERKMGPRRLGRRNREGGKEDGWN